MLPSRKPAVRVPANMYRTFHSTQISGKPQAMFCVSMDDSCWASCFCLFGVDLVSLTCENVYFLKHLFIYLDAPGLSCSAWDLVSWPGMEPGPPALEVWSLSHWTTREVPGDVYFFKGCIAALKKVQVLLTRKRKKWTLGKQPEIYASVTMWPNTCQ